ncbi:MAG: PKD domain-containing protein [Candidatus Kapaibacterium sp.]
MKYLRFIPSHTRILLLTMALLALLCAARDLRAEGGHPPHIIPIADFDRDSVICEDICLNFRDMSGGDPTSWEWSFPGATPAASTEQNPKSICYGKAGIYTVRLIASNADGRDTVVKTVRVRSQQITLDTVIGGKGLILDSMALFTTRCDSIAIRNNSTIPLILQQPQLVSGRQFSLTPGAFPIIIPPGETRKFQACFSSIDTGEVRDLIILLDSCATIVVPLVGRTPSPLLKAGISLTAGNPCGPACFDFADSTVGLPIRWHWRFPGARTDSSSEQRPRSICYDSAGSYRVTLVVEGRYGRDTTTRDIVIGRAGLLQVIALPADGELRIDSAALGSARCDSIMIANTGGGAYIVPSARMLGNIGFSAAPGQFPMLIPAGETRGIVICHAPSMEGDERDTLVLEGCNRIAIPLASRGVFGASSGSVCETRIALRGITYNRMVVRPASPYPNPGSAVVRLPVEMLIPSGMEESGRRCVVIDSRGAESGRGMYAVAERKTTGGMTRETGVVEIDVTGYSAGTYYALFSAGEARITVPIIVQR